MEMMYKEKPNEYVRTVLMPYNPKFFARALQCPDPLMEPAQSQRLAAFAAFLGKPPVFW
jgi:hypothetical protein